MMTFTKRILAILLSAALVFSFTACTSSSDDEPDQTEQVTENDEPETTEQEETDQEETEPEVTEPEVTEPVEEPEEVLELEFIPELYDDVVLTEENMAGYAPDSEGQALTYNEDGSMSAVSISSVSFNLPEEIAAGSTAILYIKGTAAADFTVALADSASSPVTDAYGIAAGDFERFIELEVLSGEDEASAPASVFVLSAVDAESPSDFTITELCVYAGTVSEYEADVEWFNNAPAELSAEYDASRFTAIPVNVDNFGHAQISNERVENDEESLTWSDDGLTVNGATLVSFNLPSGVGMGKTVVVHIKGTSDSNFRVWLLDNDEVTSSRQINMSDYFRFESGEYDYLIELTTEYFDAEIADDTARQLAFKALTWDTTLDNFTVNEIGVYYGTLDDYMAGAESNPEYAAEPVVEAGTSEDEAASGDDAETSDGEAADEQASDGEAA